MARRGLLKGSRVLDFFFFFCHTHGMWDLSSPTMACGILVPRPGIEPVSPVLEAQSHSQWASWEVPGF